MKLKLNPSREQLATLETLQKKLKSLHLQHGEAVVDLQTLPEKIRHCDNELASLESRIDPEDEKAVLKLVIKRGQRDILARRIPYHEELLINIPAQVVEHFQEFRLTLVALSRPTLEELLEATRTALRPHFGPGGKLFLEQAVLSSPRVASFTSFFQNAGHLPMLDTLVIGSIPQALTYLETLISGQNPWKDEAVDTGADEAKAAKKLATNASLQVVKLSAAKP